MAVSKSKSFCTQKGLNTKMVIFCDLSIRSGRKRLFLYDLTNDSVILAGLVAHGHCQNLYNKDAQFSNEIGSNCTAEGKYKIGGKYSGTFGTAYKLYGLDSSNSNAFNRFIVLHGHSCVPDNETLTGICRSEGCPTVSPFFLTKLEPYLDKSTKPMLLWIFKSL